jgi:hypothetical protein
MLVDIPGLAFAVREHVDSVMGRPHRVKTDRNIMNWSEGKVTLAYYSRTECMFLTNRLVSITHRFSAQPAKVEGPAPIKPITAYFVDPLDSHSDLPANLAPNGFRRVFHTPLKRSKRRCR